MSSANVVPHVWRANRIGDDNILAIDRCAHSPTDTWRGQNTVAGAASEQKKEDLR